MNYATKFALSIVLILFFAGVSFSQEDDVPGSRDHPLLSRMDNFYISGYEEFDYDSHEFYDAEDNEYVIEGRKWVIDYTLREGFKSPGQVKIRKNHINAITKIGGTILYDKGLYMKVVREDKEVWIEVWVSSNGGDYRLSIVERTAMKQEVVADPDALAGDIMKQGHATVYGIYFDFDSYDIKPESEPTLTAIADMLKANPSLRIYVVGHTDMKGTLEYNMTLSRNRAESVVKALAGDYGIAESRLKAMGVGPLSPVSTNSTEDGRRLNRRVELVEMIN
jgi:outer membrane protein OmpA-like peptidoglycan-associated protein